MILMLLGWLVLAVRADAATDYNVLFDADHARFSGNEVYIGGATRIDGQVSITAFNSSTGDTLTFDISPNDIQLHTTNPPIIGFSTDVFTSPVCLGGESGYSFDFAGSPFFPVACQEGVARRLTVATDWDTCSEFRTNVTNTTGTCGNVVFSIAPTFTGTDQHDAIRVGPTSTPTTTPTATAATPTATGATPTPTVSPTPGSIVNHLMDFWKGLRVLAGQSIQFPLANFSGQGRIGIEPVFGILQIDIPPGFGLLDIRDSAGNIKFRLRSTGHLISLGTAPGTLTAGCGTTATVTGTDDTGFVTIGGTGITASCGFTFASAHTNRPPCVASFDVNGAAVGGISLVKATSTTTTLTFANFAVAAIPVALNFTAADVIAYHCEGRE